jgi:tight adherence protein B
MSVIAAVAGVLVFGGVWLAFSSWRPVPVDAGTTMPRKVWRVDHVRLTAAAACSLLVLVVTRWPVAALAGGGIGWALSGRADRRRRTDFDRRTEAIALWTEMLRDAVGTARGVEGVLVGTAATAPAPIRAEVQRMARRLQHEPIDLVLDDLAADLDHPIGDLVVTALRLTSSAGGRQAREVLGNLASAAYAEAESRRRVEVARARPRAAMRYTAVIIGAFVGLLTIFSREYFAPYDSAVGQGVLLLVGSYWAAGFWWMHRMGRVPAVERVLLPQEGGTT